MGVIKLLDEEVSQLIAAGEVVERPSSVVKELVENAIDAGASKITVEIRHGGVTLIRVSDDGCGIEPDDVPMMFLRHATSKVRNQEDLTRISTLGFRGEAMASIHAVARIEVLTRKQGSNEGVCYRGEGAQPGELTPAGCPTGTTVKVADLFYNTPARMKFLKKDVQEGNSVAGVVERIALSHPEISFQFIREGQTKMHTPGDGKLLSAIHAVYGKEFTKGLVPVHYQQGQIQVDGYISLPAASRSNRTMQNFFVNARYVKSVTARTALEEAYKHSIMVGKFPACVLNLTIPFTETDINVHPAKIEVRFTNERPVFDAVYYAVKNALLKEDYTPLPKTAQTTKKPMTVFDLQRRPQVEQTDFEQLLTPPKQNVPQRMSAQEYRQMMEGTASKKPVQQQPKQSIQKQNLWEQPSGTKKEPPKQPEPEKAKTPKFDLDALEDIRFEFHDHKPEVAKWEQEHPIILIDEPRFPKEEETETEQNAQPNCLQAEDNVPCKTIQDQTKPMLQQENSRETKSQNPAQDAEICVSEIKPEQTFQTKQEMEKKADFPREISKPQPQLKLIGEVLGTYLVVEGENQMILIDKHAAHERIIFNRLRKRKYTDDRQLLLEPVMVHLSREDYRGIAQNLELFEQAGFLVEDFGDGDLIVREVPVLLSGAQIREIVEKTAHDLSQNKKDLTPQALDELLHSVACKSAVRANDKNTMPELWEIVQLLQVDEDAKYCPHGRPVAKIFSKRDLERMFGRLG